jgi:hypothetical protein
MQIYKNEQESTAVRLLFIYQSNLYNCVIVGMLDLLSVQLHQNKVQADKRNKLGGFQPASELYRPNDRRGRQSSAEFCG